MPALGSSFLPCDEWTYNSHFYDVLYRIGIIFSVAVITMIACIIRVSVKSANMIPLFILVDNALQAIQSHYHRSSNYHHYIVYYSAGILACLLWVSIYSLWHCTKVSCAHVMGLLWYDFSMMVTSLYLNTIITGMWDSHIVLLLIYVLTQQLVEWGDDKHMIYMILNLQKSVNALLMTTCTLWSAVIIKPTQWGCSI